MAGCHNIHAPLRGFYCSFILGASQAPVLCVGCCRLVRFCVLCSMLNSFFSLISNPKSSTLCLSCNNGFLDLTENTLSLNLYPKHGHAEVTLLVILAIRVRLSHSHKDITQGRLLTLQQHLNYECVWNVFVLMRRCSHQFMYFSVAEQQNTTEYCLYVIGLIVVAWQPDQIWRKGL
jgi:hypothetical protein